MRSDIKIRQLSAFHAVMTTGSVSGAADLLNLTQPAISKHLSALEHAVGLRLFERRSGSRLTATREGIAFYRSAESILAGVQELPAIAQDISRQARERLRVAATPPIINSQQMVSALALFRADHPDVHLSLEPKHRLEIEDWVTRRQVDLALALFPMETRSLHAEVLASTQVVVALAPSHPLANRTQIGLTDIENEPLILPNRQPLRTRIDPVLQDLPDGPNITIEVSSAITCCRLAAAKLGITICDPFSPTAFSAGELKVLPWTPEIQLDYGVFFQHDNSLGEVGRALLDCVQKSFREGLPLVGEAPPAG